MIKILLASLQTNRVDETKRRRKRRMQNSLKGLMLKLKLQYFGHMMQRADSVECDAGKD